MSEFKTDKDNLCNEISELLMEFQKKYGVVVTDIDYKVDAYDDGFGTLYCQSSLDLTFKTTDIFDKNEQESL